MNHLYHSLSPLIVLTAFIVSLLAFLAPTPILAGSALLKVATNVSTSAASKRWLAHDAPVAQAYSHRMVKRAKKANSSASATAVPVTVDINIGPLGACYTNLTTSRLSCTYPSFTPIFVQLYDDALKLPSAASAPLPEQFPLAPTALFVALCLLAVQLLAVLFSSASMHATKRLAFIGKKQVTLRKAATVCGVVGLIVGVAATAALRVQLGKAADEADKVDGVDAKLGSGFNQLFAGLALQAVGVLLLIAEAFTSK